METATLPACMSASPGAETADEVIARVRPHLVNPSARLARHKRGASVAVWTEEKGWYAIADWHIAGFWDVHCRECSINGERWHKQDEWIEVPA